MAWELREIRSPWLPGGVGSPAGLQARRSIPAKWEARLVRGNPVVLRLKGSLTSSPSTLPDRVEAWSEGTELSDITSAMC